MSNGNGNGRENLVSVECRPERRLIRPGGSYRHMDFVVRVADGPATGSAERPPLALSLVLDRSGSMQGEKLATAKKAVLALLGRLEPRDQVALTVFDDRVDVVQPLAYASMDTKESIRRQLERIEARAGTNLHEGWLVGCRAIAADDTAAAGTRIAHCFLLTDGQANEGLTDPEQIAVQAAGVLENAGIGTSSYGIGDYYDESLLRPMATAGGGHFVNLRSAGEIAGAFMGRAGELLSVAAGQVRLELDGGRDVTTEVISDYWASQPRPGVSPVSITIGDLPAAEERHVVVRFGFPPHAELAVRTIMARVTWVAGGEARTSDWQEVGFSYAGHSSCDAEAMDMVTMHWVGLHHAERARLAATELARRGEVREARGLLDRVVRRIAGYAGADRELQDVVRELRALSEELSRRNITSAEAKEMSYQSHRRSRGQKDFRI